MKSQKIGVVGQGWVGNSYSFDFERRGYQVIRYDIVGKYKNNKSKMADCSIIFMAVPTPSTEHTRFDDSILINAIKDNTIKNQIIVIKSTIQIGVTDKIQNIFSDRYITYSPEFLVEKTVNYDVANPSRNIIGYTKKSLVAAKKVLEILPEAKYEVVIPCREAELIKYAGNILLYIKVVACNLIYDVAELYHVDYNKVKAAVSEDNRIGGSHMYINWEGGRGAGGDCFIKDFVSFMDMYEKGSNKSGAKLLKAIEDYNKFLLIETGKDLKLLKGIYGEDIK